MHGGLKPTLHPTSPQAALPPDYGMAILGLCCALYANEVRVLFERCICGDKSPARPGGLAIVQRPIGFCFTQFVLQIFVFFPY